ncbi:hypothetical protein FRC08_003238 [Ceratobasidium sp. 394]|nr:hypothetical protein FRC08_003238 [Ceratobasidium sp. 394]
MFGGFAPSEAKASSEVGGDSDAKATTVGTIPRCDKTKHKHLKGDLETELEACIARITTSKSSAHETFEDPIMDYKVSPPTHYSFKCKNCGKYVPHCINVSETSGLINHANRCITHTKQTNILDGYGITGPSATLNQEDMHEFFALWLRKLLDPQARKYMPHRNTISEDIKRIYKSMQEEITAKLVSIPGVFHLALDMCQVGNGEDYLGIVFFHLGKPERKPIRVEHFLLECLSFGGELHTGEALAWAVHDVLCKFKIQDHVWGVVCNNASNNTKMVDHLVQYGLKRLTGLKSRVFCLLHVLNLMAQAIMYGFRKSQLTTNSGKDDEDGYDLLLDIDNNLSDAEDGDDNDHAPSWALGVDEEDPFIVVELPTVEPGSPEVLESAQVGRVLFKLAKFTHKLRYSPKACATFKRVCAKKEVKCPHSVRHDIMTRWNSLGDMSKDGDRTFPAM